MDNVNLDGTGYIPNSSLSFHATNGTISSPFEIGVIGNHTFISQPDETGATNGGLAQYPFLITNAGSYTIDCIVNASGTNFDSSSNSFFVNIDADPGSPTNASTVTNWIWDIKTSEIPGEFTNRTVSWRCGGSFDDPHCDPKSWWLSATNHTLFFRGREANTKLEYITIVGPTTSTNVPAPSVLRIGTYHPSLTFVRIDFALNTSCSGVIIQTNTSAPPVEESAMTNFVAINPPYGYTNEWHTGVGDYKWTNSGVLIVLTNSEGVVTSNHFLLAAPKVSYSAMGGAIPGVTNPIMSSFGGMIVTH